MSVSKTVSEWYRTGRVRALTNWYKVGSVIGKRYRRQLISVKLSAYTMQAQFNFRFLTKFGFSQKRT